MKANRIPRIDSTRTPKPARAFGGPGTVGFEFDDGIDSLVIARDQPPTDANRSVIPDTFTVNEVVPNTTAATAANYGVFWTAPYPVEVVGVNERHVTAGSDGGAVTLMVKKVPSGTAAASGSDVLSAGISLKGTANTNAAGSLHATAGNLQLAAGDSLALVPTGTLTAVAHVAVTVRLKRRPV